MMKAGKTGLKLLLAMSLGSWSWYSYAKEFISIIGPDGRPLVVPRTATEQKTKTKKVQTASVSYSSPKVLSQHAGQKPHSASENNLTKAEPEMRLVQPVQLEVEAKVGYPEVEAATQVTSFLASNVSQSKPQQAVTLPHPTPAPKSGFSHIDGVDYVESEYLESKEFNLEGKKRFYSMPEGVVDKNIGSTRIQTVEREKGVGQSILKSLFAGPSVDTAPITLAQSYYRISQSETVESLGQQCFKHKKVQQAKHMIVGKRINLWPRAPLKADEFDFEIVRLDPGIKNVQIQSYAARQHNPAYYWPFAVFLDQKACVLEGAGGFKSQQQAANIIRHEYIEGIIQVPEQARYLLLTPLASAIDIEDKQLTNYGQLKLVAIR
ncbi:MAG TPA: putative pilus assembly protein FilE [Acinetobacter lwoffii]|uniref:Pilus assembly protein FilE n=1 Tax=Acinetobacter lwoffii TaxID=28090 RepID=A0A9D2UUH8_ACILW|nr:putative pilus assembly protein FilE [Acinetobacter lwoffii]